MQKAVQKPDSAKYDLVTGKQVINFNVAGLMQWKAYWLTYNNAKGKIEHVQLIYQILLKAVYLSKVNDSNKNDVSLLNY